MSGPFLLSPEEWTALRLSLQVAAWCVLLTAAPGVLVGWLLARRRFPGRTLLDAIVHLPLVMPPVVVGYLLLLALGRQGLGGLLGIDVALSFWAAVIASAVMGFPLLVRPVRLAMELADRRLDEAARTLGATPLHAFLTVTVPLAAPGIVAGVVLAFARSLGEFGATITFAGNIAGQTRTLPLAVFSYSQAPGGDAAALRLAAVSVVLALLALIISEVLSRRLKRMIPGAG